MSEKSYAEWQKAFSDIELSITLLYNKKNKGERDGKIKKRILKNKIV